MTFAAYVDARNDSSRPMGLWGPRGGPAFYRIDGARRPVPARPAPQRGTARDDVVTFRLEQHRKAAEADKVVARLRRLR
jgi:hypothetical protein